MKRFAKTTLLLGTAVLALSACSGSGKGPGKLGSKDDIVVRNNGLPGAQQAQTAQNGISSTVEQLAPQPAAEVAAGEPLAAPAAGEPAGMSEPLQSTDPSVVTAAQQVADNNAPVPSTTVTPTQDGTTASTAPSTQTIPADIVAPEPVNQPVAVPAPAPAPVASSNTVPSGTPVEVPAPASSPSSVYPASDYPAVQTPSTKAPVAPAPVAAAAEPTVVQTATESVPAPVATPVAPAVAMPPANLNDPVVIKSTQAALKLKGYYKGAESGVLDSELLNALSKYQGDNKLAQGGINAETMRHLGVIQ